MVVPPRTSLGRILDDLGSTLLDLVAGDPDAADDIRGVAIHDPYDDQVLPSRAMVLGIGVQGPEAVVRLLDRVGGDGAAALVVRAPVAVDDAVRAAVSRTGTVLLALTQGASWTQLAALLRSLLAEGDAAAHGSDTLGGVPAGDLFAMANAVSALLDAPVTIEDRSARVLAFSGRQVEADPSRIETVLGRQVPQRYVEALEQLGVFRDLYRSDRPIFLDPARLGLPDVYVPRAAIVVRAGDEILGSVWAAVREPLSAEREQTLVDAAKVVALHMLRDRAGADVERRLRADLVATVLEGGPGAREAANRLGLARRPAAVLALASAEDCSTVPSPRVAAQRERLASAFALHLFAVHPGSAAALVGGIVYGILPLAGSGALDDDRSSRVVHEFLRSTGDRFGAVVGIGRTAEDVPGLAQSRADADNALRALRQGRPGRRVAHIDDVNVEVLLLRLADLAAVEDYSPVRPVARLLAHDAEHGTQLVETLRAWLDAFGDVNAAADVVHVHPNTFRYRMRRLVEIAGLDLDDPHVRFAVMLQFRLLHDGR